MSPANDKDFRDDDMLAAEYVVGALPDEERKAAAARAENDAAFASLVEAWQQNLAPMDDAFLPVDPPAAVKAAIDSRLFGLSARPQAGARGEMASRAGLWNSLAFWRGAAAAAAIVAAVLAAAPLAMGPPAPEAGGRLVASLAPQQSEVHYVVVYDARNADIGLSHVTGERASGSDFELWVIEGDHPPASLGIIPEGSTVHLAVGEELRRLIEAGAVVAISVEPAGGSPTGQPTGPVVAAGDLRGI